MDERKASNHEFESVTVRALEVDVDSVMLPMEPRGCSLRDDRCCLSALSMDTNLPSIILFTSLEPKRRRPGASGSCPSRSGGGDTDRDLERRERDRDLDRDDSLECDDDDDDDERRLERDLDLDLDLDDLDLDLDRRFDDRRGERERDRERRFRLLIDDDDLVAACLLDTLLVCRAFDSDRDRDRDRDLRRRLDEPLRR
jgi:hypothetical protein